jgi:hypothetical protein
MKGPVHLPAAPRQQLKLFTPFMLSHGVVFATKAGGDAELFRLGRGRYSQTREAARRWQIPSPERDQFRRGMVFAAILRRETLLEAGRSSPGSESLNRLC